jgi:carbonic anhydrase/acetyltransferase-like protein (isoleucine patch superfamily)
MIQTFNKLIPSISNSAYIDPQSRVIGDVTIGEDSSVWPFTVIRGDMHSITIGQRCSIQDNSVLHITHSSQYNPGGHALIIGDDCTIGHKVCLHGCTLNNRVLVGIGTIIMDGVTVHDDVIIGANSFVPPNKSLDSGFLYLGSPAKAVRALTPKEMEQLKYMALNYVKLKQQYLNQ